MELQDGEFESRVEHINFKNNIAHLISLYFIHRTLRMLEAGLIKKWTNQYQPKPYQCFLSSIELEKQSGPPPRLSLQNLSGAFLFLVVGYAISLFLLLHEFFFVKFVFRKTAVIYL